ncbi:MAG TPA: hypothetical protein VEB42_02860 [Chitinophagaceae bacterium]|nr:hypothetical protein [Chitinophagaceae bacterium]
MKKILLIALIFVGYTAVAQDLTGTWEGQFVKGTVGLRQPAKMVLEIVQVEGKLYGIFDLYPIDTRKEDKPNITYTVEGNYSPKNARQSLTIGRVVEGSYGPEFIQFVFDAKSGNTIEEIAGKWFRRLEPVNTSERGAGTFVIKRISNQVSKRLALQQKEKEILQKLEKQDNDSK